MLFSTTLFASKSKFRLGVMTKGKALLKARKYAIKHNEPVDVCLTHCIRIEFVANPRLKTRALTKNRTRRKAKKV